jgi:hypothetical protein
MSDQKFIYSDEAAGQFLWEDGPEGGRTVHLRFGLLHLEMRPEDALAAFQMLKVWHSNFGLVSSAAKDLDFERSFAKFMGPITCDRPSSSPVKVIGSEPEGIHPVYQSTYQRERVERILERRESLSMGCNIMEPVSCSICAAREADDDKE